VEEFVKHELNGKVLPLCMIGTWAWGNGINGSKMVFGKRYSEEQLIQTFHRAYDLGFTFWDTAEVYGMGNAEKLLGRCIGKSVEERKEITVSTKHLPAKRYKEGEVANAIDGSLRRMGVDSIDLYWLHQPYALRENMHEMIQCMKDGKIKSIGLSNCNIMQLKEACNILEQQGLKLAAVQNHFSLLSIERQKEVVEYCNRHNILFFGYMVLEQGALSGSYDSRHPFPLFSMRGLSFGKSKFKNIQALIDYERQLADKYSVDASQIPIAWAIAKQVIPIIGLTKSKHAEALATGVKIKLSVDEIEQLELLAQKSGVKCKGSWE